MLCQGEQGECTPCLFNVFLMLLTERLFFDMLSLPTGAKAPRASWLAGWLAAGWLKSVSRPFSAALFIYASEISMHSLAHEKSRSPTKQNTEVKAFSSGQR